MFTNARYKGKLFIIAAPSGGGKTSVTQGVINSIRKLAPIERAITFTTRNPRRGEIDGQDYHFVSQEEFLSLKNQGFFIETTMYNGNYYGSPSSIISDLKSGMSFIMITDIAGAKNFVKNILPSAVTIWIAVPSLEILRQRLENRKSEDSESLQKRLKLAQEEIAIANSEGIFKYHVLNDDLQKAVAQVSEIIQKELNFNR